MVRRRLKMNKTWLTRLTASMAALSLCGGLTFMSGCDKDCDDCDHDHGAKVSYSDCAPSGPAVTGEVINKEQPINTDYTPAENVSYDAEVVSTWTDRDLQMKRERLDEIDREKALYPDRADRLGAEADRIHAQIDEYN